ncbi:MAG: serine/threonine-protein kinase [Planctomycetota bacterium]|nr:serine/threonine-protein kinase [Planctomycetota bacterium]
MQSLDRFAKAMEMTDSLSNRSAGEGGSSLGEAAFGATNDANSDSLGQQLSVARPTPEISPDELTVISQNVHTGVDKETFTTLEGRRIGHFELKQFLGGGGMGLVFRAFDSVLSRSVAIKLLPRTGTSKETTQRFQVEARSAARLDHPNISRVFQVGSDEICDYIIFEFVEGDNLAQLVRRIGPLPLELGLRYTFQLALAIQHAYQRGVVHRDVKPANVVVTDGGKLKLIDLGLARSPKENETDQSLTQTGVTLGTYDYLSPEQARDSRSADVRSDLYSLGCTLFFMFTGQPPYPQGTPIEKIIQHSSEKRPKPSDYRTDLPHGFDEMTAKLLAIDPTDRYQKPAELIAEVQDLASRNNIPLLGYDDNVVVKKIIQKPTWTMQLVPVLVPIVLLVCFVLYLDRSGSSMPVQPVNSNTDFSGNPTNEQLAGRPDRVAGDLKKSVESKGPQNSGAETGSDLSASNPGAPAGQGPTEDPAGSQQDPIKEVAPQKGSLPNFVAVGAPTAENENALSVDDLESALEAVNADPRLNEIRIFENAILLDKPISVKVNQSLLITSGGEQESILIFRPQDLSDNGMFRIRGGNIEFKNIHLRMETGSLADPADGPRPAAVSLLELEGVLSTSFSDCSLTVANDRDGAKVVDNASFFSVLPKKRNLAMFEIAPKETSVPKPSMAFVKCCVRGEAAFVQMADSFPMTFQFENGLFVSDSRMFELGPAEIPAGTANGDIEIYLNRMTSISSLGLIHYDAGPASSILPVRIETEQSIFNYGTGTSLVTHANVSQTFVRNQSLVFKCFDSFFPQQNDVWTIQFRDTETDSQKLNFGVSDDWLKVIGVVGKTSEVTWKQSEGLTIPASEHTVFDYELTGGKLKNEAIRKDAGLNLQGFSAIPPAVLD